ncbi:Putative GTP-binding protein YdgA [Salmonella enterica subsp. arizonae]|uniref:GTP-binding protein YdgA n=1 Tax=Salmonella enterica subsp. arizonae TaxID=59203 RepID=A0A379S5R6_SALER|nr:Putative GTP-binding protein YdgA [Salmonella enterica subsp. arizonae]
MGQMFRLTTLKDNTIASSLQYANGQITLNGQKMPLEDFVGLFGCRRFPFRTFRRCLNNNRLAGCRDAAPGLRRTTRSLYFCVTRRAAIV